MNLVVKSRVRQFGVVAALVLGAGAVAFAARPARQGEPENRWTAVIERAASDDAALTALRSALGPSADPALRVEVLHAIENTTEPAAALMPLVAGVLQQPVDADTLLTALRAMGGFRQREAVGEVLRFASSAKDIFQRPELVTQAAATLSRQTGRVDPTGEIDSWTRWFDSTKGLGERGWAEMVAGLHAERSKEAEQRRAESEARLAGVYRRLLVSLPEKDRAPVIAEMILSDAAEVRVLGVDQATRAVLNGVTIGPEVAAAGISRLNDPDQAVRAEAATLLEKLDDPRIAAAAGAALERESSPVPAAAILRVLATHPVPSALRDVAAWLDSVGPAFAPAVEAALALERSGAMKDPDLTARVRDVLSALPMNRHTAGTVTLLARVGGVERVAGLIDSASEDVAVAAARAVVDSPEMVDRVVAAASGAGRPRALFEPAVQMLAKHRPTAAGFAQAETLTPPSAERGAAALSAYAAALPMSELLLVSNRQSDLVIRERYLSAAAPGAEVSPVLARTRLQLKNPGGALAGLDAACPLGGPIGPNPDPASGASACDAWAAPLRVTALAWLGRVEEAVAETRRVGVAGVPVEAWLEALAAAREMPHAGKIESAVRELYSTRLTEEQSARLEALGGSGR
jgi:hypothetical protein